MVLLHPVSDFINPNATVNNSSPSYYYQGYCPQTGELLRLPRTPLAEKIAYGLMQHLAEDEIYSCEGKMYGILLVEMPDGQQRILKAFSGLLNGCSALEGWVTPIPGREEVALQEARTLGELENIKQELIQLQQLPQRQRYETIALEFQVRLQQMSTRHSDRKQQRKEKRQILYETLCGYPLTIALEKLEEESRGDGIERKLLKGERDEVLKPLKQEIDNADMRMRELKQQRKELSRQLQGQMHAAYSLMNFGGRSQTLQELMPQGLPTGTGDCCAPKLLHYAATHGLKPLGMAEFWWGSRNGDKVPGEFYGACRERCQPLMGFLLSGLSQGKSTNNKADTLKGAATETKSVKTGLVCIAPGLSLRVELTKAEIPIIYEDEWLIAVNKPPGLLSVPGRYYHNQDSVVSRLRNLLPDGERLLSVHRLDEETSGILLLARDLQSYKQVSQQFQKRQVHKVYEAVLSAVVNTEQGVIELPLWGNPENRPYQEVNWEYGKPSVTNFRVIGKEGNYSIQNSGQGCPPHKLFSNLTQALYTRVELIPLTGRTHQLRVHAADEKGLGVPILGDQLYGCGAGVSRLHLHARELYFQHPQLGERVHLRVETPF
ncbi:MAG: pseudouridine synthase [Nostocaceae cyanobacterium]|nr:pseudouridine synthase [Nostocaceae cyanobacterium]